MVAPLARCRKSETRGASYGGNPAGTPLLNGTLFKSSVDNLPLPAYDITATAAISLAGSATASLSYPATSTGAVVLTGSASGSLTYPNTVSGTLSLAGSASGALAPFPATASGNIALTALAAGALAFANSASGQVSIGGAPVVSVLRYITTALGLLTLQGTGAASQLLIPASGIGAIGVEGSANAGLRYAVNAAGSVTLTAIATARADAEGFIGWGVPI